MIRRFLLLATCWPLLLPAQLTLPRTLPLSADGSLRIWVPSGSVRVETWDKDSIRVTGTVARGSSFFAGGAATTAKLGVENLDAKSTAMARGNLVVTVPRLAHVWLKMTEGEATVRGTFGELQVITVAGTIAVSDAGGVVSVETIDAAVSLSRIDGAVRVSGGSGRQQLSDLHGTLTATTVSGAIDLGGVQLPESHVEAIGGAIAVRGSMAPETIVELVTHGGPVTLQVDRTAVPALVLSSRSGVVNNPLGKGNSALGRFVVHTFKGAINVQPMTGIEGRKSGNSP